VESAAPILEPAPLFRVESPSRRPRWRVTTVGLAGVLVAFVGFGLLHALEQPPFVAPDETAHVGYAHDVASLSLPEISEFPVVPDSATQWRAERESARDDRYRGVWVANHPPLSYVAVAPLIWLSRAGDAADGGLILLRFANVAFAAVGVALTYKLAEELTDGDRGLALMSAALVAVIPHGHAVFSQALNDGFGFACSTAVVWAGVRAIRRDDRHFRRDLVLLGAAAAACFGARATTMLVATAVVATVAVYWFSRPTSTWARRRRDAGRVILVGLLPAVVLFGWFYVRNIALYGDIGASRYLLDWFERQRRGSVVDMVTRGEMWVHVYQGLLSPSTVARRLPRFTNVLSALAVAGVVVVAVTGRIHRGVTSPLGSAVVRWRVVLCLVAVGTLGLTLAQHVSGGGNPYSRYLLPAIGVIATLFVVGMERLLPRWGPVALVAVTGWWAVTNLPVGVDPESVRRPRDRGTPPPELLRVLPLSDSWRTGAGVLIVLGLVVAVASMLVMTFARRRDGSDAHMSRRGTRITTR
jgi:Dolichyl-phosphate-mannose-protein mannosyltransferase